MFVIKFLRWLRGYVIFRAEGAFVEEFLNRIVRAGILVWGTFKNGIQLTGRIRARDYRHLRPYAKKTGVRLRVVRRKGVPFFLYRYRKRLGIFIGLTVALLFLWGMSLFVWDIQVTGNEVIDAGDVLRTVEEMGLKIGAFRPSLTARDFERRLILDYKEISWVAVNITGSTVNIHLKERTLPPEMLPNDDKPANVVAAKSGQIVRVVATDGQAMVKRGDAVNQGDLLISGIMEDKYGKITVRHARGEVWADVNETISLEVPLEETVEEHSGEIRNRYWLRLFSLRIPLTWGEITGKAEVETSSRQLGIGFITLPFFLESQEYRMVQDVTLQYTEEQARKLAMQRLEEEAQRRFEGAEILSQKLSGQLNADGTAFTVTGEYLVRMDIAAQQDIGTH